MRPRLSVRAPVPRRVDLHLRMIQFIQEQARALSQCAYCCWLVTNLRVQGESVGNSVNWHVG